MLYMLIFAAVKKIIALLLFPVLLSAQTVARVVGIKDGDTVVVLLKGNVQKTLRLAEVDCPETGSLLVKMPKNLLFPKFSEKASLM